jgi:membrane fusion protein, multidrug efflux system
MDEPQTQATVAVPEGTVTQTSARPPLWRRRPVIVIGTVIAGLLLFQAFDYVALTLTHESTDDAFLDSHILTVAPKVAGQVKRVCVTDNQAVPAGELLLEIDPRDLQVQLDQKEAAVHAAQANIDLLKANLDLSRAQVASAEATAKQAAAEAMAAQATAERANADLKRAEELMGNRTISPQEYDTAKANATAAEASLRAAREKAASNQAKVGEVQAQVAASQKALDRGESQARQAEADARAAELNLSYTRILAPEAGRVTRKAVETGDYLQVGQSLMALVPTKLWVTANFKETQLENIRLQQPVKLRIDSVPSQEFSGHVDSIQAGSGARFSLLPPENAVGNFVKVVQRVPVKIVFDQPPDPALALGPGMSVVPSVKVKDLEIPEVVLVIAAGIGALIIGGLWWRAASRRATR